MYGYVKIYRDEVSNKVFEKYLGMTNSIYVPEDEDEKGYIEEHIMFYTINIDNIPLSKVLDIGT